MIRTASRALQRLASGTVPRSEMVQGTLVFCDVSGFTAATEKLGRRGRIGAELMNELIVLSFSGMLDIAEELGGDLLVFGGDALFLLFDGPNHVERGVCAAVGMRRSLRSTTAARRKIVNDVTIGVSTGVHTGDVWLGVAGSRFPLLFPAGPAVTRVLQLEHAAARGEILVSSEVRDALTSSEVRNPPTSSEVRNPPTKATFAPHPSEAGSHLLQTFTFKDATPAARHDETPHDAGAVPERLLIDPILSEFVESANVLEHRDGAVAFVRCNGTDDLSNASRLECIHQFVEQTAAEAAAQGVCIMSSDIGQNGVKLMLSAGLPTVRGEDADRLVSTLLRAVEPIESVELSAGAQAGPLLSGFVGSPSRRVYTGAGDVVNSAARIAANTSPGEVAIGDGVADRLRASWQMRVRAPFPAKGKKAPVSTRAVLGRLAPKMGVTAFSLPFVGRDEEAEAIRQTMATPDGWVEIIGEPGSGKSRLLGEVVLHAPDLRILECFGDPTASDSPYHAIGPALLSWISGGEDPALVGESVLQSLLAELRVDGDDISELLGHAVRALFGVDGRRADSVAVDRRTVHRIVIDVLKKASPDPSVLVIEDAQWIDASSVELVLALRSSSLDMRLVSTRRPEGDGLRADEHMARRLHLQALEADVLRSAARSVANDLGVSRSELEALIAKAEGNPLVVELLLDARSRGLPADDLPPRAEELAGRLLDSLLPIHRHLLGVAAVCGEGADLALVSRVAGLAEHQAEAQFDSLHELSEISPVDGSIRFRHAIVRDAAYNRLPFRERFALHAKVASFVERSVTETNDIPLLAYHFHRAGDHARSWKYGREAGDRARFADAPVEAAANYRRALADAGHLDDVPIAELTSTWEAFGESEQRNGRPEAAERAFAEAFRLTGLLRAELLRKRGRLAADTRRLSVATRWYAKAARVAKSTDGRRTDQFLTGLAIDGAAIRYRQGKFKLAEQTLVNAVKQARRLHDDRHLPHGLYLLALVSGELGRPLAIQHAEEAAALYETRGDKLGLARTLNNLGVIHQLTGEWESAVEVYRRSEAAYLSAGDNNGAATIQNNLGEILSDQGFHTEARAELTAALETWNESMFVIGVALATSNLGRLEGRAASDDSGKTLLETSTAMFTKLGGWDFVFETRLRLAEHALRVGDVEGVDRLLAVVPDTMVEAAKLPGRAAQRARLRGAAAFLAGDQRDALTFFTNALQQAEQAQNLYEQANIAAAIARFTDFVDPEVTEKHRLQADEWFDQLGVLSHMRGAI